MTAPAGYRQVEAERRIANLIMAGTIASVDHAAARVRVQVGDLLTAPLPWLSSRAGQDRAWWPPEVGEQVLLLSPSGDPAQGWVLTGAYQDSAPAPSEDPDVCRVAFKDGAVIEYDRKAHKLSASLPAGSTALLVADGGLTIQGPVTIEGDVDVTGEVSVDGGVTASDDVKAGDISLQKHVHGGVQAGGATTGAPQ